MQIPHCSGQHHDVASGLKVPQDQPAHPTANCKLAAEGRRWLVLSRLADWMFERGRQAFTGEWPSRTTYATLRAAIGKTRQRMYATNVATARSPAVITAELISFRTIW